LRRQERGFDVDKWNIFTRSRLIGFQRRNGREEEEVEE
jgi:hypothetical protein